MHHHPHSFFGRALLTFGLVFVWFGSASAFLSVSSHKTVAATVVQTPTETVASTTSPTVSPFNALSAVVTAIATNIAATISEATVAEVTEPVVYVEASSSVETIATTSEATESALSPTPTPTAKPTAPVVQTKPVHTATPAPAAPTPIVPAPAAPVAVVVPQTSVTATFIEELAASLHERTNAERAKAHVAPLTYSNALAADAATYSTAMLDEDFFSHTDPSGCDMDCRFVTTHPAAISWGENLAYWQADYTPSVSEVSNYIMKLWLKSDEHRANILDSKFTVEGIGIAMGDGKIYITAHFMDLP